MKSIYHWNIDAPSLSLTAEKEESHKVLYVVEEVRSYAPPGNIVNQHCMNDYKLFL